MILETILGALATVSAKKGVDAVGRIVADAIKQNVQIDTSGSRSALLDHLVFLSHWAEEHSLADPSSSNRIRDLYVELSCERVTEARGDSPTATISVTALLGSKDNHVILGPPGAGKTTSLQNLARLLLERREAGGANVPILFRFRRLESKSSLVDELCKTLGISVNVGPAAERAPIQFWRRRALTDYLDSVGAVLLLDGLDEAPHGSEMSLQTEIEDLLLHSQSLRCILTCRSAAYVRPIPRSQSFTIMPLNPDQALEIAIRWLGEVRAKTFLKSLDKRSLAGAYVLPLALAQLCTLYLRRGAIPDRSTEIYESLVRLLIEDWDTRRGVVRQSSYSQLTPSGKERFLRAVAYQLTAAGHRGSFSNRALRGAYSGICADFGLPWDESTQVAREIESHTGLIQQMASDEYAFAHKTYQEYLTAAYLLSLSRAFVAAVPEMPEELAVTIALTPRPGEYLEDLLIYVSGERRDCAQFAYRLLKRVILERPEFRRSARLGWVLLSWWSVGHTPGFDTIVHGSLGYGLQRSDEDEDSEDDDSREFESVDQFDRDSYYASRTAAFEGFGNPLPEAVNEAAIEMLRSDPALRSSVFLALDKSEVVSTSSEAVGLRSTDGTANDLIRAVTGSKNGKPVLTLPASLVARLNSEAFNVN